MAKRYGRTVVFQNPVSIVSGASVAGKKESEGPLSATFDSIVEDSFAGEKTWEKAESSLQKRALRIAIEKAGLTADSIDCMFAGDLLNQCIASSFSARSFGIPVFGAYGACSTMAETLILAAMAIDGGFAEKAAAVVSSHFCTAERQFRLPLEYGGQRTPTAQWTVTGSGAMILGNVGNAPYITHATCGRIVDLGIKDANNMGAAMAPAAYDTISALMRDTSTSPDDYDIILTGDLGKVGSDILCELFARDSVDITHAHRDCGVMIFDCEHQDVHAGGSGCGCSASVLCGYILNLFRSGQLSRIIFAATGALMSTVSSQQGESIPGICHAVIISNRR